MLVSVTRVLAQRGRNSTRVVVFQDRGEISRHDISFEDHVVGYQALGRQDVHYNPPETVCGVSDGEGIGGPSTLLRDETCRFSGYYWPCLLSTARIRLVTQD